MRKFIFIIIGSFIAIAIFCSVNWNSFGSSMSLQPITCASDNEETEVAEPEDLWIDTIMYAGGHSFGYSGDVSMWGGWYFDTIPVGDDQMLSYDSVGPSTLKLSLVTRILIVDLKDPDASVKIRDFMQPINGFRRFRKSYEECLDSVEDEEYGVMKYMGEFTFRVDYPDSCMENREAVNRFICEMAGISESERAKVPGLSAFYAGFNQTKIYRPVYTGNSNDIQCLSDFMAHKTFENWIRAGEFGIGSSAETLALTSHIANTGFVTFGKYEYDRVGIGHGMYTETFHTLNLKSGKKLTNRDLFKSQSLDKVKMRLFEVMAKDSHYLAWNDGLESPNEIESRIEGWQSPSPILEGTEWEEPDREVKFEIPEGALTDSGVIFSFQPYEIDCWAAGAFHFIVPYKQLMPYLTPEAKRLISTCKSK